MSTPLAAWAAAGLFAMTGAPVVQEMPEQYREPFAKSYPIREKQHLQMKAYLDGFPARTPDETETEFKLDFASPEAYARSLTPVREEARRRAGFPPPKAVAEPKPRFELVASDPAADIYRVWTEVIEGVDAYALYMVPRGLEGKAPLIIAVHGGSGCPEAICDLDTRINYRAFGREAVKRGYIVYAPGILMAVTYADPPDPMPEGADYKTLGTRAEALGTSTRALQVYGIIEGAKAVVKARPEIDGDRIGMTGLSMGGGFTMATAPLWEGIKAAVCSAGFSSRGGPEPAEGQDLAVLRVGPRMTGAGNAALICPRPLMIQSGETDTVVPLEGARKAFPAARAYYEKLGIGGRIELNVHPGGHVFENEAVFGFFDKHLFGK
jgi:dienelactone hydrolase